MIIKPTTVQKLKSLYQDLFLSTTTKVTKISNGSVLDAHSQGVAKIAQKILKDVGLLEANIFADASSGDNLDGIAQRDGLPARFGALGSSTFVLLYGAAGTIYPSATVTFTSASGIAFDLAEDTTLDANGYAYARITSQTTGADTNIDAHSITVINNAPVGHELMTNLFMGDGGRDAESDSVLRQRVKNFVNLLSVDTITKYEQVLIYTNNKVLRVLNGGLSVTGAVLLYVVSVNGVDFTGVELTALENALLPFMSASDQTTGVAIENLSAYYIDIDVSIETDGVRDVDLIRKDMQIAMVRSIDWRYYELRTVVDWEAFLIAAKQTQGVVRVLDESFSPRTDLYPPNFAMPRIRGFILRDENGNILSSNSGADSPLYVPNNFDYIFQQTLIA